MLLFLTACLSTSTYVYEVCDLDLDAPTAVPGQDLIVTGGPQGPRRDTTALLDGTAVEVVAVVREDCDLCDACVSAEECTTCGACIPCESTCAACTETVTVRLPETAPAGSAQLTVVNGFGSGTVPIEIVGPSTSTGDTGTSP